MRRLPGEVTRRDTLALGAWAVTTLVVRPALGQSEAQAEVERHGMSGFGDLQYPADFKHFAYVNPNAPKGGQFSQLGSVRWYNQNFSGVVAAPQNCLATDKARATAQHIQLMAEEKDLGFQPRPHLKRRCQ